MWGCGEGGELAGLFIGRSPQISHWQCSETKVVGGRQMCTLMGHACDVNNVAFSPDGKHIASGLWDNLVKIRNAETGALVSSFVGVR